MVVFLKLKIASNSVCNKKVQFQSTNDIFLLDFHNRFPVALSLLCVPGH